MSPDVVVVGGGPAGSTAATMLARQGLRVVLFEREQFPRDRVGESLLPASVPILEELGVRDAVDARFPRKYGATMVWGREPEPWSWYFRETNASYPHAWQVWRADFDAILLDSARDSGVDVRCGVAVRSASVGSVRLDDGSVVECGFVVDASGQAALVGRARRLRRFDPVFRNMAVYAYFAPAARLPAPDQTNILVESYGDGWLWTIPLPDGVASVGAVVDGDAARDVRATERFLRDQIEAGRHTAALLEGAALVRGPYVVRDWSYSSDEMVGDGWILAGDAACFVDPLFSSGVHLALSAGLMAAAYVTTALDGDAALAASARESYTALYTTQYRHFHEMARLFYSSNRTTDSYFWEARRITGEDARWTPREAFVRAVAGQPPRGYERAVLERGVLPDEFTSSVLRAQHELASRARSFDASAPLRIADGVSVRRTAVLGAGRFEWGHVLVTPSRPAGVEVGEAVAALIARADGRTPAREVAAGNAQALSALRTLYVDGALDGG